MFMSLESDLVNRQEQSCGKGRLFLVGNSVVKRYFQTSPSQPCEPCQPHQVLITEVRAGEEQVFFDTFASHMVPLRRNRSFYVLKTTISNISKSPSMEVSEFESV